MTNDNKPPARINFSKHLDGKLHSIIWSGLSFFKFSKESEFVGFSCRLKYLNKPAMLNKLIRNER